MSDRGRAAPAEDQCMGLRALLPSLGAGGSLVAAAVVAAAMVSALIAFEGSPARFGDATRATVSLAAVQQVGAGDCARDGGRDGAWRGWLREPGPTRS